MRRWIFNLLALAFLLGTLMALMEGIWWLAVVMLFLIVTCLIFGKAETGD